MHCLTNWVQKNDFMHPPYTWLIYSPLRCCNASFSYLKAHDSLQLDVAQTPQLTLDVAQTPQLTLD